jgi:hypothetical protein
MKTLCTQCDKVLTDAQGRRLESANFPGDRPTKPMTSDITYAYCDGCMATPTLIDLLREARGTLAKLRQYPTNYQYNTKVDSLLRQAIQDLQSRRMLDK